MLVLVSGAARVLGSKFVDDLTLKALLDTVLCDGTSMDLSSMNQSFMFVMANLSTYVSKNVWTWS